MNSPSTVQIQNSNLPSQSSERKSDINNSEWSAHRDQNGKLFFHNKKTGETRWDPPNTVKTVFNFDTLKTSKRSSQKDSDDSSMSNLERESAKILFNKYDEDGDGSISISELAVMMKNLGINPSDGQLMKMVDIIDVDNNGKIEFEEFVSMLSIVNIPSSNLLYLVNGNNMMYDEKNESGGNDSQKNGNAKSHNINHWEEFTDDKTGRNYYVNRATGHTQWEVPEIILQAWTKATKERFEKRERFSQLSEREIQDAKISFQKFDRDKSGAISETELMEAMGFLGQYPTIDEMREMMAFIDKDASGTIDFDEYCTLLSLVPQADDWDEFEDEKTLKPYFRHKITGEVKWKRIDLKKKEKANKDEKK
eukprot:g4500.t1